MIRITDKEANNITNHGDFYSLEDYCLNNKLLNYRKEVLFDKKNDNSPYLLFLTSKGVKKIYINPDFSDSIKEINITEENSKNFMVYQGFNEDFDFIEEILYEDLEEFEKISLK